MSGHCVAVFDWDNTQLGQLISKLVAVLKDLGIRVSAASIVDESSPKPKKLNPREIEVLSTEPQHCTGLEAQLTPDGVIYASERAITRVFIVYGSTLSMSEARSLLSATTGDLVAGYGYCFECVRDKRDPVLSSLGVFEGDPSNDAQELIADEYAKWFNERIPLGSNPPQLRHKRGMVRDVYSLNLLNAKHLDANIESQSMQSWINASSERGNLWQIGADAWLWEVESQQINALRKSLTHAGLVIGST